MTTVALNRDLRWLNNRVSEAQAVAESHNEVSEVLTKRFNSELPELRLRLDDQDSRLKRFETRIGTLKGITEGYGNSIDVMRRRYDECLTQLRGLCNLGDRLDASDRSYMAIKGQLVTLHGDLLTLQGRVLGTEGDIQQIKVQLLDQSTSDTLNTERTARVFREEVNKVDQRHNDAIKILTKQLTQLNGQSQLKIDFAEAAQKAELGVNDILRRLDLNEAKMRDYGDESTRNHAEVHFFPRETREPHYSA